MKFKVMGYHYIQHMFLFFRFFSNYHEVPLLLYLQLTFRIKYFLEGLVPQKKKKKKISWY